MVTFTLVPRFGFQIILEERLHVYDAFAETRGTSSDKENPTNVGADRTVRGDGPAAACGRREGKSFRNFRHSRHSEILLSDPKPK